MPYWDLKSFQQSVIIYDFTVEFCDKYIDKKSRTHDQMVQAARSGKQNIAEGCSQSKNKPKSEHYLLCIASASLKELFEDYQDFLRQRGLKQWGKDDPRAIVMRQLAYRSDRSDKSDRSYMSYRTYLDNPERAANAMITLINQTTYLLDQQIKAVEKQMKEKGIMLETQNQKILRSDMGTRKQAEGFWQDQKQAGTIKLITGQFKNIKDLSLEELTSLRLDEDWLSQGEARELWKKFNKS